MVLARDDAPSDIVIISIGHDHIFIGREEPFRCPAPMKGLGFFGWGLVG